MRKRAALTNHRSERQGRLAGAVDAVLHKRLRREEWQQLFGPWADCQRELRQIAVGTDQSLSKRPVLSSTLIR
jgi:hypothetical protein